MLSTFYSKEFVQKISTVVLWQFRTDICPRRKNNFKWNLNPGQNKTCLYWSFLQIHHEYFTLKRCGNDRFHVVSTWTARDVFVELWHSSSFWRSFTHFWFIILIFYNVLQYSEGFAAAYQKGINYLVCTHFLLLLCAQSCAYQGVKNVSCSKYVAYVPNR